MTEDGVVISAEHDVAHAIEFGSAGYVGSEVHALNTSIAMAVSEV